MERTTLLLRQLCAPAVVAAVALAGCQIEEAVDPVPVPEATPTPASGSVDLAVPVALGWDLSADVAWGDSFKVYADTVRPPRVEVYAGTARTFTLGDLTDGRTYFWQVAATDSSGAEYVFGPWSFAVRPFRCQLAPDPDHLTRNLEPDPVLSWTIVSASDTPSYYLAYCDSVNPPQRLVYAGPDSSFRLTGLEFETDYFWRVTAVDGGDNTDTSGPWRFTTGPPLFLVDLAPAPADSATDLDRVVTLSWSLVWSSAPVENYVVFLDDHPQPTTLVHAGTDQAVTLTGLRYGRSYWWTVTAFDDEGHTFTNGPWLLTIRDFDVEAVPTPADGSTQVSLAGNLGWTVTRGAALVVNYVVCLDASPHPTTPVYTGPLTAVPLAGLGLAPGATYHWRVTALDVDGYACPLGPWSFTVAP